MNEKLENGGIFGLGEKNPFGQFFIGQSYLNLLSNEQIGICNVTFEPGCRNNWHTHHAAGRSCFVPVGAAGIRNGARRPASCIPEMWSIFPQR